MQFPSDTVPSQSVPASQVDPYLYLRQADLALTQGNREQAVALIVKVYLAFDLLAAGSDEISDRGTSPPEKSN
jgi:hypothetical protein